MSTTEHSATNEMLPEPTVIKKLEGRAWDLLPTGTIARSGRDQLVYRKIGFEGREVWWDGQRGAWREGRLNNAQMIDGKGFAVLQLPNGAQLREQFKNDIHKVAMLSRRAEDTFKDVQAVARISLDEQRKLATLLGQPADESSAPNAEEFMHQIPFSEVPEGGEVLVEGRKGLLRKKNGQLYLEIDRNSWREITIEPDTIVWSIKA